MGCQEYRSLRRCLPTPYAETITEAILNLIAVFHDEALFEPQLDFAIRGWAHQSTEVMIRVNASDKIRLDAIRRMFERFGYDRSDADVRARTVYLTQIGVYLDAGSRILRAPYGAGARLMS
jgi:hypothetical protein